MEFRRRPLFQILFFNGYEYYFKFDYQYESFKLCGLNIKDIENKAGTFCLKILSNVDNLIHYVDNCEENFYSNDNNLDNIRNILHNFAKDIEIFDYPFDSIFSKITSNELLSKIENQNLKIKETEKALNFLKGFLKNGDNDVLSDYKRTQKKMKNLKKIKYDSFAISILDDYIYSINNARLFIDYYFNFINDDKIRKSLKYKSPNIRAYSVQALCNLTLSLPENEKILSIIDNNTLIPTTSYILHKSNISNTSKKIRMEKYIEYENLLYNGNINNDIVYYVEIHNIYSISHLLNASINYLIQNNITICKCKNCGKYFIPTNKNNETLCDNIYKNRKNM